MCQAVRDAEREKELKLRHTSVQRDLPRPTEVTKSLKLLMLTSLTFQQIQPQSVYISVHLSIREFCMFVGLFINTILGLCSFSEYLPASKL